MNAQTQLQDKVKNGKWVADAKEGATKAQEDLIKQGTDLLSSAKEEISDAIDYGTKNAQKFSKNAVSFAKKYPVQTAVGALAGIFIGLKLFRASR